MLNKGYKNPRSFAPVDCDLMDKLIVIKEDILSRDISACELWNKYYNPIYQLAKNNVCIAKVVEILAEFLYRSGTIRDDVFISYYSMDFNESDIELGNRAVTELCIPFGFCTKNDLTRTPLIGFTVTSNYSEVRLYKIMYFDGSSVRIFTPYAGNPVNVVTGAALGDELSSGIRANIADKYIESDTCKEIFGEDFTARNLLNQEICGNRYLEHFEVKAVRKPDKLFMGAKIPFEFGLILEELEQNLQSQIPE